MLALCFLFFYFSVSTKFQVCWTRKVRKICSNRNLKWNFFHCVEYFARKLYRRFLSVGLKLEDYIVTKSEDLREAIREFQTVYFQEEDDDLQISLDINMTPRNERDGKEKFIYPKVTS